MQRHTDTTKLAVDFRNVANTPKNEPSGSGGTAAWTRFIWLWIWTCGGRFWIRQWTLKFKKRRGIYWIDEELLASQEESCFMEFGVRSTHCRGGLVSPQPVWTLWRQNLCFGQNYNCWVSSRQADSRVTVLKYRGFQWRGDKIKYFADTRHSSSYAVSVSTEIAFLPLTVSFLFFFFFNFLPYYVQHSSSY